MLVHTIILKNMQYVGNYTNEKTNAIKVFYLG